MSNGNEIYRKVDILGRFTIPVELRNSMGIKNDVTYLGIKKVGNTLVLSKPRCTPEKLVKHVNGKNIRIFICFCGKECDVTMNYCPYCGNILEWD